MTKCQIHDCELRELFTSSYCEMCEAPSEEKPKADIAWLVKKLYADTTNVMVAINATDANGSPVSSPFADALLADLDRSLSAFVRNVEDEGFQAVKARFCKTREAAVANTVFLSVMSRCDTIWRWESMGFIDEAEARELELQEMQANDIVYRRMKGD